jgi:hypothetical protein
MIATVATSPISRATDISRVRNLPVHDWGQQLLQLSETKAPGRCLVDPFTLSPQVRSIGWHALTPTSVRAVLDANLPP